MRNVRALCVSFVGISLSIFALACGSDGNPSQTGSGGAAGTGGSGGAAGTGGMGGMGGMSMSSSSGMGGAGGEGGCKTAADCPGVESECGIRTCTAGVCGMMPLKQAGAELGSQLYGDCKKATCDGAGNIVQVEDKTDRYDDGNACTLDSCQNGEPIHVNQDPGFPCGNNKCDGNGRCVYCIVGGNDCSANTYCVESTNYINAQTIDPVGNRCAPNACKNGMKDGVESDVDCGGAGPNSCAPCPVGKVCTGKADCVWASCLPPDLNKPLDKVCFDPTCMDGVLNGEETVTDLGGSTCPPVPTVGAACHLPTDCETGVCQAGKCVAPTCFDATKNGDEVGVDCGGSCAAVCLTP